MDRGKIKLLFYTIKYLKPIQIYYRLFYFVRNRFFKKSYKKEFNVERKKALHWNDTLLSPNSYIEKTKFNFLNIEKDFNQEIDWNFKEFGMLWAFNINYFDFLNQQTIDVKDGIRLIKDYISKDSLLKVGKASYPISLRGINWVKFLIKNKISDKEIDKYLYNDYQILFYNPEYHLLGNHLLENGFALLFGAYYFKDELLYKQALKILKTELIEQTLNDGGHFELSPMYHQMMLFRVLDCIQLIKLNLWKNDDLLLFLESIASRMTSWLKEVTFDNGEIPMVNDSSFGIARSTEELLYYGERLRIQPKDTKLSDSGYRMFKNQKFELFVDVGHVGASYQPAHAHSDTFNFILYVDKQPVVVDTGVSTYEKNALRQSERSTSSHNTVQIGNIEQTQVWGGFRVAERAKIISLSEEDCLEATHNGYKNLGVEHTRKFDMHTNTIFIKDSFSKKTKEQQIAYFHLHPTIIDISIEDSRVCIGDKKIELNFTGKNVLIERVNYRFAAGFNRTLDAIKLKVLFESTLETTIQL